MPKRNHNSLSNIEKKATVGVIGAGSFGTAVSNLLAVNQPVLLFARRKEVVDQINLDHTFQGIPLSENIRAVNSLQELADECTLIFPIVPSNNFRELIKSLAPFLKPYHLLIHGTKGLDVHDPEVVLGSNERDRIHTMSEVILQESCVLRVGCLSGPNLSAEIFEGQPAATVIASRYTEVIKAGAKALRSRKFQVYGTKDITGAELAGALKNIIAVAAGILGGLGLGKNIWSLLITRGLIEMIHLGKAMGAEKSAFLGLAGIGDLVATASSTKSRNYSFGIRLAKGQKWEEIKKEMPELAEGVRTLKIAKDVAEYYNTRTPIIDVLYRIVYEDMDISKAINYLMTFPYTVDVDFL